MLWGPDNPYTKDTLNNTYGYAKQKITKNTSNVEKAKIKASQRIWNILINETLGEPKADWAIRKSKKRGVTGTRPTKMWDLNESKLKKLSKALNKNWRVQGYYPATLETVYKLAENIELMEALDNYKGGKIGNDHPILKALLTGEKTGAKAHAYTILGEAWRGDIELEGITKNLKRGNSVIKSLHGNFEGPLGSSFLQWAKRQMAKDFDNPKATYTGLVRTMRDAFNSAGLNHLAVDEIFPTRTGQLTIGKGSGAYNHIVQFIDGKINSKQKKSFDAIAAKRYQAIIAARKDKNWDRVNQLVEKHKAAVTDFYEVNPEAKGKVRLTQLNYDPKTHTFASPTEIYGKDVIPSKILKGMEKFHEKTGLSLDVGSTMTLEKAAADIKKDPTKFLKIITEGIKIIKALPYEEQVKIAKANNCPIPIGKKAEGGRIGFGAGSGSMLACIDAKWEKDPKEFWKRTANIGSQGLDKLWFYAAPYWFPAVIAATGRLEAFKHPTEPEMWWDIMIASDAVKRWGLDEASLSQLKNASWTRRLRIINDLLLKFPGDKILTQAAKVAKPLIIATETLSAVRGIKTELDLVKEYALKNNIPYEKAKLAYYASGAALKPRWEGDKSFKSWAFS